MIPTGLPGPETQNAAPIAVGSGVESFEIGGDFNNQYSGEPAKGKVTVVTPLDIRRRLIANGYRPVPCNGKAADGVDWPNSHATEADLHGDHWVKATNTGIILGDQLLAVDIDVRDEHLAAELREMALSLGDGLPPVRIGQAPKTLLLFRTPRGVKKHATKGVWQRGVPRAERIKVNKNQIEILGEGQQFVAFGTHPDTKRPYVWTPDSQSPLEIRLDDLPLIDLAKLDAFLNASSAIFAAAGYVQLNDAPPAYTDAPMAPDDPMADLLGDIPMVRPTAPLLDDGDDLMGLWETERPRAWETERERFTSALYAIPANIGNDDGWFSIIGAWHYESRGADDARDTFLEWCKQDAAGFNLREVLSRWKSLGERNGVTPTKAGTLYGIAKSHGWNAGRSEAEDPATVKARRDLSRQALNLAKEYAQSGKSRDDWTAALKADPDLAGWANDERLAKRAWAKASQTLDGYALTEDGVALAFTAKFCDDLRFCHDTGRWYRWSGQHWRRETTQLAFDWVRETCREMGASDPLSPAAKVLSRANTATAVEKFARADRAHAATADAWDRNPWLLGTPGGVVELKTGVVRQADPADMVTKLTAAAPIPLDRFDPARDCPRWLAFLDQVLDADAGAIRFLQQWAGYSLTGDTREEALLFVHGPGGSGKSTAINTLGDALGDYCTNVATETLSASKYDRHPTEIARLKGARMARASETEEGRAWAQQRITAMTGGDVLTARFMRQDDFEFRPEFKLTIVGNHAPAIQNVDGAIRRRFNVLPFNYRPAAADQTLKDALRTEWPGILSWAMLGCLDWQAHGLVRPRVVVETTDAYLDAQDSFALWLDEDCERGGGLAARTEDLWVSWSFFARRAGEDPGSKTKTFPERMKQAGLETIRDSCGIRGRGFKGISVRATVDDGFGS